MLSEYFSVNFNKKYNIYFLESEVMNEETFKKMTLLINLLHSIWYSIHSWFENKNLLELP
jgi:hypothetical protein